MAMIPVPDMRQCKACGAWLPIDEHHYAPSSRSRQAVTLRRECRQCQSRAACQRDHARRSDPETAEAYRASRAASARRYAAANREKVHEWQAADRQRVKEDPERAAARRATHRANYRRRRRFGKEWIDEPDYEPPMATSGGLVDAEPFLAFARDVFPNASPNELARLFKIDGSGAKRVFSGEHQRISLIVVDRALTEGLGRPDLLDVLYPLEET